MVTSWISSFSKSHLSLDLLMSGSSPVRRQSEAGIATLPWSVVSSNSLVVFTFCTLESPSRVWILVSTNRSVLSPISSGFCALTSRCVNFLPPLSLRLGTVINCLLSSAKNRLACHEKLEPSCSGSCGRRPCWNSFFTFIIWFPSNSVRTFSGKMDSLKIH